MKGLLRSKVLIILLTLSMVFGIFTIGMTKSLEVSSIKLARMYGEFDVSSEELITVIVEIEEPSMVEAKHNGRKQTKERILTANNKVIKELKGAIGNVTVNRDYHHVFAGFSVELPENRIPTLLSIPGVKAVYPNVQYQVEQIGKELMFLGDAINPNMLDSAPYIGSQKVWDAGFTGKGIVVAILDTGVDYTHPDLVHAFGDYKGWDFVDNNDDPQETSVGDPDLDTDHGTHVAGTVAANGLIKGVAPEATLLAYRVLGPGGRGSTENVLAGIERAVKDGAHIMNLSLGNSQNNPDFATSIALDWAMAEGVVAVTSNGNNGPDNWTVGSPGTSRQAISVGATRLPYNEYNVEVSSGDLTFSSAKIMGYDGEVNLIALQGKELEFKAAGFGLLEDFIGNYEGKIAVISRGAIPFVQMATNAKARGAVGVIVYNHLEGEIPFVIPGMELPTIKMTKADGLKLLASESKKIAFEFDMVRSVGETIADFSSRGPAMNTWMIKPDVSAPGVAIVSTIPTHNPANPHGYAAFQGTSMAAPHVAGAAALILQANPEWCVNYVKAALMNTAENLYDENGNLYPHNSQGAGSIRVLDAINTKVLVTPGSHSFGVFRRDEGKEVRRQSFTIHNLSNERKRYYIEFTGNEGIKVQTSNNLQIQPGRTQNLNFGVKVDSKLPPGYYEGTFLVSDGKDTIKIPTILFVGEPDYPRILLTGAIFGPNGDGAYTVGAQIPFGADWIEYDLFHFDNGRVGELIEETFLGPFFNVPGPVHKAVWDGTIAGEQLPDGPYVLYIWVVKDGRAEYKAYLIIK